MTQIDGEKLTKKTSLRNNEYYVTQEMFDKLYNVNVNIFLYKNWKIIMYNN